LNSTVDNMVADYMDNLPEAVMQPETPEMGEVADDLTDVVGWALHHAGFKPEWRRAVEDATVTGTGIMHVFWDDEATFGSAQGGIGLTAWRPDYWMPDPLYSNFQDGRAVFKVCMHPLSYFMQHFPETADYIDPDAHRMLPSEELQKRDDQRYDDPLVALLEVWFRRYDAQTGKYAVNMAQVAGGALLYDSREENPGGVYAHGKYPFVTLRFREREDSAYGTGMVYEFADTQRIINRCARYMDENGRASSKMRLIVNRNAGLDMAAATDMNRDVIEADRADDSVFSWSQARPLNSQVMNMTQWLQDTQKQDSGQNQFSRGEGGLGVTAASAISMLQEAGGKITRMHTSAYMDAFREAVEQIVALTAEFLSDERTLMITGREDGSPMREISMSGARIRGSGASRPSITVRVNVQRTNPQQVTAYNQLVMQMAEISAQANSPIPAGMLMRALRVSGKDEVVKLLDAADAQHKQLAQLMQAVETLQAENEQLKEATEQAGQELSAQKALIDQTAMHMRVAPQSSQPAPQPAPIQGAPMNAISGQSAL
ncbi:MAG: hypothetical protein RSA12_10530, partial [Clostridia bacterium]